MVFLEHLHAVWQLFYREGSQLVKPTLDDQLLEQLFGDVHVRTSTVNDSIHRHVLQAHNDGPAVVPCSIEFGDHACLIQFTRVAKHNPFLAILYSDCEMANVPRLVELRKQAGVAALLKRKGLQWDSAAVFDGR